MNKRNQWLITELQTVSDIGQIDWRSLVNHVTFRDELTTATGTATAAFHVDDTLKTWLFSSKMVVDYAPLLRQKLLLHELFHAVQYENLVSFFAGDKQKAAAFHNEVCMQQSGFAVLYARNEVEAEAFAVYALINYYGRQLVEAAGLISTAQTYLRGYIIVGNAAFPRRLRNIYGDELENLYPTPEATIARHKSKGPSD